jgi:hypothetical protein
MARPIDLVRARSCFLPPDCSPGVARLRNVVTDASTGDLVTAHPGFPIIAGYTYWDIVLGA